MEKKKQPSIKKNYIFGVFYEVLKLITPFITTPYVARILEADGIGDYSYTLSIITYFVLVCGLGTAGYGEREIARSRDDPKTASKLFWEIELVTVISSSVCLVVWGGVIVFSTDYQMIFLAHLPLILGTMFDISWYFTGLERLDKVVSVYSIVKLLGIIALFVFVRTKGDLVVYCLIHSLSSLVSALSMWLFLPATLKRVDLRDMKLGHHFHETFIYFIPTIATSIYTVLDKTLIGALTGNRYQNGYYEEATKILNIVKSFVFVSVNKVMGARISYLFSEKKYEEIKQRISKSMNYIYLLGFGAAFGIIGIASRFVPLFFGEGYEPVVGLLYLMAPMILIIGTSNCLGSQYYTPSGQRKRSAKVIVLGAFINLCLNLLLIPLFEAIGATIASVIAEMVITVLYVRKSDHYMSGAELLKYSYKRLVAGAIMSVIVYMEGLFLPLPDLPVIVLQLLSGVVVYAGILMLLKDPMIFELIRMVKKLISAKWKKVSALGRMKPNE